MLYLVQWQTSAEKKRFTVSEIEVSAHFPRRSFITDDSRHAAKLEATAKSLVPRDSEAVHAFDPGRKRLVTKTDLARIPTGV